MTPPEIDKALEAIYASLHNNNEGLDPLILALKIALKAHNVRSIEIDPAKIPQPNRQGRKLMRAYFQKRGVAITFPEMRAEPAE